MFTIERSTEELIAIFKETSSKIDVTWGVLQKTLEILKHEPIRGTLMNFENFMFIQIDGEYKGELGPAFGTFAETGALSPAGLVMISDTLVNSYTMDEFRFILMHEYAHSLPELVELQKTDPRECEIQADNVALQVAGLDKKAVKPILIKSIEIIAAKRNVTCEKRIGQVIGQVSYRF